MPTPIMKVKQLRRLLDKMPDDAWVILSHDAEGNSFSPAVACTLEATYLAGRNPWDYGEIYTKEDPNFNHPNGQRAFVLWPS